MTGWNSWDEMTQELPRLPPAFFDDPLFGKEKTEDRFRAGDHETTPEGEPRWRYAARRARIALIEEGLMTKTRPGSWQLA